jgi:hypothetical protein
MEQPILDRASQAAETALTVGVPFQPFARRRRVATLSRTP